MDLLEPRLIAGDHHIMELEYARDLGRSFYKTEGWKTLPKMLTSPSGNTKLAKNLLPTYGLTLMPHTGSGVNLCPHATEGCAKACLNTAGRGVYSNVQRARLVKTQFLATFPGAMITLVQHEIDKAVEKHGEIAVRLNVLSDLRWELIMPSWFTRWGDAVKFYDYTKWPRRDKAPDNYHITYSWHENATRLEDKLERFGRVAVVFDKVPEEWRGVTCIDGDTSDQRWNDNMVIVALKAKGEAKHDTSGFVQKG